MAQLEMAQFDHNYKKNRLMAELQKYIYKKIATISF